MNIDEMQAGQEIDLLVDEKVMGQEWAHPVTWKNRLVIDCAPDISYGPDGAIKTWPHIGKYLPYYSTDVTAWNALRNRMIELGFVCKTISYLDGNHKVIFATPEADVDFNCVYSAPTMMLAGSRAALKAIEEL